MHFLRPLVVLVLALAWLPTTNNGALAAIEPGVFAHCTDDDQETGESAPCNNRCANCVTNENGSDTSALGVLKMHAPEWREDIRLSEWLKAALSPIRQNVEEDSRVVPADDRPPWRIVVRIAPPVRGPSYS